MLTLKEFVKETLSAIADGVSEFNQERGEAGATTNPRLESTKGSDWLSNGMLFAGWDKDGGVNYATLVDFDIAVTAEDIEKAKAGGGIRVVSFLQAEGGLENQSANSTVSRMKFRLPLQIR